MSENLPAVIQKAAQLQSIDPTKVNMILPTQSFGDLIGEYDKVTLEVVTISANEDDGECYSLKRGQYSFGKVPLQKIGNALGIVWDPKLTTVIESTATKSRAKATGAMRKPNGEWVVLSEEKTVDLAAIEEEQRLSKEEEAEKGPITGWDKSGNGKSYPKRGEFKNDAEKQSWIDREVRKAMLSYLKFKDERAMTGAKERAIKALVAIKNNYSEAELKKPFVFPRIAPDVSKMLDNEKTREAALRMMTGGITTVYGPSEEAQDVTPEREALPEPDDTPDTVEVVDDFDTFDAPETEPGEDPRRKLRIQLDEWLLAEPVASSPKARSIIDEVIAKGDEATIEEMQAVIKRCQDYAAKKSGKVAS